MCKENDIKTKAADALAPCVAGLSAAMVSTMLNERVLIFLERISITYIISVSRNDKNVNTNLFFLKTIHYAKG